MFDLSIYEAEWPGYPVDRLRNSSVGGRSSPSIQISDRCSGIVVGPRRAEPLSTAKKASIPTRDPFARRGDRTHIRGLTGSPIAADPGNPQPRRKATRDPQKETAPIPARMTPHTEQN
jgi:hypothetical protein